MLIDFLKNLIPEASIVDLFFRDKEKLGKSAEDRKAVFDIYCENEKGEKIIIELQKAKQNYFKDRTIFYATFPILEQAEKGDWNFNLKSVFCIGILDFTFEETRNEEKEVIHTIELKDQKNQIFYDKLKFIYLEMPHFTKQENELETRLDKWLYFIKHLEDFQSIPEIFKDDIFIQAFGKAEIANYTEEERKNYEESLKTYRDLKNTIDTAFDDGKIDEKREVVKIGREMGLSIADLIKLTGLTAEEISKI
jgi:predicted transposase/invertase (TIGR01784 family)